MAFYSFEDTSVQQVLYSVIASIVQYLRKMCIVTFSSRNAAYLSAAKHIGRMHKVNNVKLNQT